MSSLQALRIRPRRAVRDLASFKANDGVVLSLYVGFDPSVTRTGDETAARIASLLEQATRASEAERLEHDARLAFSRDLERARDEVLSRLGPAGVACFADSADGLWHVEERRGLPDLAKVQSCPYLVPLVAAPAEEHALVAVVGRERGEVFELRDGRMEQLADLSEDQPRRHHAGHAWHQPSLERHSDELAHAHLRHVATRLDNLLRDPDDTPVLVLAGEQRQTAALRGMLSQNARTALAGVIHPPAHATPSHLKQLTLPVLQQHRRRGEDELLDRWQAMKADGAAVQGWPDTLVSASDGRISMLLFRERVTRPAFVCGTCDRASAQAGICPLDGQPLTRQPDGLDIAVRLTLRHGGEARAIRHRTDLDHAGAIGALLNF